MYWFFETAFLYSLEPEPVLELALVDQADSELTEIRLPLPPKCWDYICILLIGRKDEKCEQQ